jgi:ABC-type sugar transport system substrate-binding protein
MTAINEAVRIAEEQYHTPVVIYKDRITGASRVCVEYSDYEAAEAMAKECVQWIEDKYGTTDGKTVIALNGDLRLSGWKMRADGFRWIKENHPEINFIEINGGMSPEGWADVAEASIGGAGKDAVALLAGSDGAYLLGALNALEKYGKLHYVGEEDHMFVASIDGKPSTLTWLRRGYIDLVYSQTPDSIAASLWNIAKEHIVDDPSYQYSPYEIPEIPLPLEVEQPEGCYWGGEDLTMTVKDVPDSDTPIGKTPSPRVDRNNVNNWDLWGNSIIKMIGSDMDPVPEYDAKGTQPAWSKKLMDEFNSWK